MAFNFFVKSNKRNIVHLYATVALNGASVPSVPAGQANDFTVALTPGKTGRYTLSGFPTGLSLETIDTNVEEVADAAIATAVLPTCIRDNLMATATPSVKVQFVSGTADTAQVSKTVRFHVVCRR